MSKADIWMPLYIGDYLSDTTRLTTEQHGAYLLLLLDYWKSGAPPDNDEVLAQITRLPLDRWVNAKSILQAYFQVSNGHWLHSRVERELSDAKNKKDRATNRAQLGAKARWGNKDASSIQQALPNDMRKQCPSPSPSPSHNINIEPTVLVDQDKPERLPPCPTKELIDLYHKHLPMLPRVELISDQRKKSLSARWRQIVTDEDMPKDADAEKLREDALSWFDWYFNYVSKSDFLTGRSKDWRADFDFLITASKFTKVVEGHYHKG